MKTILPILFSLLVASTGLAAVAIPPGDINPLATGTILGRSAVGTGAASALTTIPSAVQDNITRTGTISSGTWNGTLLGGQYGGTGVANTGKTITLGGNLATSGAFGLTLSLSALTNVTMPTTGTLATLAGSEAFTNKTYNGLTVTSTTGTLTIAALKTLTVSNTLTFTGTDGSSVAFGTGGTVLYSGGSGFVSSITGTSGQVTASAATGAVTLSLPAAITGIASVTLNGTGGAGFMTFPTQSSTPSAPASGFAEFADATGRRSWIRASDGFVRTWDATLTASRVYTLPDANSSIPVFGQTITFAGPTAARTVTFPDASFTAARTDAANSFTGIQTILGTNTLKFGATAQASIGVSADTSAGNLNITATSSGAVAFLSTTKFLKDVWNTSSDGVERLYFVSNSNTYIKGGAADGSGNAIVLRNGANTDLAAISGTAGLTLTGGAGSMTITAGTGNSRTLALQSTTSGGTATTFLTGNATQDVGISVGNLTIDTAGKTVTVKSGSNAKAGTFTLSSGAATVSNTSVTANSVVKMSLKTASGAITAAPYLTAITAATSFVVAAGVGDNSTYNYVILEVN